MLKAFKKTEKGFTLLETLVAISIIGLALVAATAALQNSLQTSNFVKDQITAHFLAEDTMEYIIAARDAGVAGYDMYGHGVAPSWVTNLLPCISTADTSGLGLFCTTDSFAGLTQNYINQASFDITKLGTSTRPIYAPTVDSMTASWGTPIYLCYENGAQVYEQISPSCANKTKFRRMVTITPIQIVSANDPNSYSEMVVTVTVSWQNGHYATPVTYKLSQDLYNWQPQS
jgi:prepilin-type N-terminal cleavage/methylation domain-containing protein